MHKDTRIHGIFTFILVVCFLAYDQFMRAAPQVEKYRHVKEMQLPHDLWVVTVGNAQRLMGK